jgi:hypothetical protein
MRKKTISHGVNHKHNRHPRTCMMHDDDILEAEQTVQRHKVIQDRCNMPTYISKYERSNYDSIINQYILFDGMSTRIVVY